MRHHLRDVPDLHVALDRLADEHVYLAGPDVEGHPTRWIPCSSCDAVITVSASNPCVVSAICEDCARPCSNVDCDLRVFEHVDGRCEPKV